MVALGDKMTDQNVNRIIAEYMGWKYCPTHSPSPVFTHEKFDWQYPEYFKYTQSLDALVPVWKKYGNGILSQMAKELESLEDNGYNESYIYQSLSHATADAIIISELKKEKNK